MANESVLKYKPNVHGAEDAALLTDVFFMHQQTEQQQQQKEIYQGFTLKNGTQDEYFHALGKPQKSADDFRRDRLCFDHDENKCTIGERVASSPNGSLFVFFYSGVMAAIKNKLWLVPVDGLLCETGIERELSWISLDLLFTRLAHENKIKNHTFVFLIDGRNFVDPYGRSCVPPVFELPVLPPHFVVDFAHTTGIAEAGNIYDLDGHGCYALSLKKAITSDLAMKTTIITNTTDADAFRSCDYNHNVLDVLTDAHFHCSKLSEAQRFQQEEKDELSEHSQEPWFMTSIRKSICFF